VDWQVPPGLRTTAMPPGFNQQRALSNLIRYTALYEHDVGNDAEVVELMLDLERHAAAVGRTSPTLISMLVAFGIDSLMSNTVIDLAPSFDVATDGKRAATTRPASPQRCGG
jgi:hypothetical protein